MKRIVAHARVSKRWATRKGIFSAKPVSRAFADHDPDREGFLHPCAFVGTNSQQVFISELPLTRPNQAAAPLRVKSPDYNSYADDFVRSCRYAARVEQMNRYALR